MATAVIMPRQGQSVESCIMGEWQKQKGDPVEEGEVLFSYETDKAAFDEKAQVSGTLLDIYFEPGDDVPCLTTVCVIGEPGENTSEFQPENARSAEPAAEPAAGSAESRPVRQDIKPDYARPEASTGKPETARHEEQSKPGQAASPRARNLAGRNELDWRQLAGSGPGGRIIERDVRAIISEPGWREKSLAGVAAGTAAAAEAARPESAESWSEPHSRVRRLIGKAMQQSLAQMAQLTLNSSFDASDILQLRKRLKQAAAKPDRYPDMSLLQNLPTINDLILYAAARVLKRHPSCNAWYDDEKMTYFRPVHLGVAVDTPRGLLVPTLFQADSMSLPELSAAVRSLARDCQQGTVNPDLLQGASFTVTNLGTLGVESFTPVINPPQTCILGVCSLVSRIREQDGEITTYPAIGLSLTFDHRALDGAPAARFLQDLVQTLEDFTLLLLQEKEP